MARDYDTKVHKFRTSLFGFNRKDVVHYLEKLNTAALNDREQLLRTHRDAEQMYSDLVRLNAEKKELTEKNTAQMEELATLKEKLKITRNTLRAGKLPAPFLFYIFLLHFPNKRCNIHIYLM